MIRFYNEEILQNRVLCDTIISTILVRIQEQIGEKKMDNNFNGQAPQQPVYQAQPQQPVYQAQPQQPVYAQAPSPVYQPQQPSQPPKMNVLELISVILSGVGLLLAILGTTFMCTCSAAETWNWKRSGAKNLFVSHPIMVLAIIGGLMAIAGVVLAIMALKQKNAPVKAGKLAWIAAAVGVFATFYAFLPTLTICGYNCALESEMDGMTEDMYNDAANSLSNSLSGLEDDLEDWGSLFD